MKIKIMYRAAAIFLTFAGLCCGIKNISHEELLINIFPRETEVAGWVLQQKVKTVSDEDFNVMYPGQTEIFKEYNMIKAGRAVYQRLGDPGNIIQIDVFMLGSDLDSFGFYSRKRGFVKIVPDIPIFKKNIQENADDFYCADGLTLCRRKEYFIKIYSIAPGDAWENIHRKFARMIIFKVPKGSEDENAWEKAIDIFNNTQSRRDIIFYRYPPPRLNFIDNVFIQYKQIKKSSIYRFISFRQSDKEAYDMFKKLLGHEKQPFILIESGIPRKAVRHFKNEFIYVAWQRNIIIGTINSNSRAVGMKELNKLCKHLSDVNNGE